MPSLAWGRHRRTMGPRSEYLHFVVRRKGYFSRANNKQRTLSQ